MSRKSKASEFVQEGYNITITGRHLEITDAMKDYAFEKIGKIERFSDRIIDVMVIMDIQKINHTVSIVLKLDNIKVASASTTTDMYKSIDTAVDKIETQLRKYRDRLKDHHARNRGSEDMNVNVLRRLREEELTDINNEIEEENQSRLANQFSHHAISSQETRPLKTLNYNEAIMKLELSGDVFLIFRNEADRKLKVIYRRSDDTFGIIEPE